jgi:hypothetical protein
VLADLLGSSKTPSIGKPYDPVHLTHVGFNNDTGECASSSSASVCRLAAWRRHGSWPEDAWPPDEQRMS